MDFLMDHMPKFVIGFVVLGVIAFAGYHIAWVNADKTATCTVESKDRASGAEGTSSMRVYTEECGVLEVSDILLLGKWDSADTYSQIDEGTTYEFDTVGWRIPLISAFPDILEARPVN